MCINPQNPRIILVIFHKCYLQVSAILEMSPSILNAVNLVHELCSRSFEGHSSHFLKIPCKS